MLNAIYVTMLISLIYNYIFKRNVRSNLNCGIFAFVGVSSDKFSPFMFNVLGVYNDTRGGDSSGVYFNKGSITGIRTDAKYEALVKSQKLHTTLRLGKYPVAIGHCRKSSVGGVSEINIQPTLLRDPKKSDKLIYVQAHNGTLTNYKELAKKYDITITDSESDSVVMCKLVGKVGFKVLAEYEGSAALVMYFTKEPNVLYAFHGQSKQYSTLTEERPLHFLNIPGVGTYISSEASPLEFIGNGDKAESFKYNVVYKLTGDKVEEFQKVERENAVLRKYTETTNYNRNWYDDDYYGGHNYPRQGATYYLPPVKKDLIQTGITRNICCSKLETNTVEVNLDKRIRYDKGFFWIGADFAHGERICDAWGYIRTPSLYTGSSSMVLYHLYFYYGVLLVNKESLEEVEKVGESFKISNSGTLYQQAIYNGISKTLAENSVFPITRLTTNAGCGYMEPSIIFPNSKQNEKNTFFTGEFEALFSDQELHFKDGDLMGYKKLVGVHTLADFVTDYPDLENFCAFGKKDGRISKVTDCVECMRLKLHDNWVNCTTCDTNTGKSTTTPEKDKSVGLNDCKNCGDTTCNFFGEGSDMGASSCKDWVPQSESEMTSMLHHTIASQLNPIVDDMTSLIDEIESSGYSHVVGEELITITTVTNKLKEIIS